MTLLPVPVPDRRAGQGLARNGRVTTERPDLFTVQGAAAAPPDDGWDAGPERRSPAGAEPTLIIDVDGFEGPLDLLLALSRSQKVDLGRISILQLADQYLDFIDTARSTRLELAADYLVMAAWLAYLKSRLLLPEPPRDDQPSGADLAAELAFRLRRLEAMRTAAARLMQRNRMGREIFARGMPEAMEIETRPIYEATLYDLLRAYADHRQRTMVTTVRVHRRAVWALAEAREILERLVGTPADWVSLDGFLTRYITPESRATVLASSFSASLELVREGRLQVRQAGPFAPLYLRAAPAAAEDDARSGEDEGRGEAEQ